MAKVPKIKIGGKEYKAQARGKVWRKFLALQQSENQQDSEEGLLEIYEFYAVVFNHKDVTVEAIEDNIELEDVYGLLPEIAEWIKEKMTAKVQKFPNE